MVLARRAGITGEDNAEQPQIATAERMPVFDSSPEGNHGAGAAFAAVVMFGAIMGVGDGPQRQSYGLTMEGIEEFRLAP